MASSVRVALLWHMHQPSYRDPLRDVQLLPMVFLHAVKDYHEMLHVLLRCPGARATFNLVPALLDQLEDVAGHAEKDLFLQTVLAPPAQVDEAERGKLLAYLFMADEKHQVLPLPRYYQLLQKKERMTGRVLPGLIFDDAEFLDLCVLFLLAWTGTAAREEEPLVQELLRKGAGFTQGEKEALVRRLLAKAGEVIPLYREALATGRVELSTTPYYHPILPLLFDLKNARATERDLPLPVTGNGFAADAPLQLDRALARSTALFGGPPAGVWPAEGAVSEETLALLSSRGIAWAATDEEVLGRSLGADLSRFPERARLYRPYRLRGEGTAIFFRDRALSDLIGFSYQRWDARAAVEHFLGQVREIRAALPFEDGVIPVILDGENAWEHYPRNGRDFLDQLYAALAREPGVKMATLSQALASSRPAPLERLVAGSWIGGRLSTWVGHAEKNAGWELLGTTREALEGARGRAPEADWVRAREELLAAEGSDWFWWLGDDHFSTISDRFDEIFRLHLQNVYRALGERPPTRLFEPIKRTVSVGLLSTPVAPFTPELDGKVTSWFEWAPAGFFDLLYEQGTMHRAGGVLHALRYGFDGERLHLRVDTDGDLSQHLLGLTLVVDSVSPTPRALEVRVGPDGAVTTEPSSVAAAVGKVAEISIPLSLLGAVPGGDILLALEVRRGAESLERAPAFSLARLRVPADYNLESWMA